MTAGISELDAEGFLTSFLTGVAYANPPGLWWQMHTGDPGDDGLDNPSADTQRAQVTFWNNPSAGAMESASALIFSSVTAQETISHFSAWDAASGGTFRASAALVTAQPVSIGDNFVIDTGDFIVRIVPIAA